MKNKFKVGLWSGLLAWLIAQIVFFCLISLNLISISGYPVIKQGHLHLVSIFIRWTILAPMVEEFWFRFLPIVATLLLTRSRFRLWTVITISSVFFGVLHGSLYNIFIQGVAGIIFSMAFLKEGYGSSVVAHSTYNFMEFIILCTSLK